MKSRATRRSFLKRLGLAAVAAPILSKLGIMSPHPLEVDGVAAQVSTDGFVLLGIDEEEPQGIKYPPPGRHPQIEDLTGDSPGTAKGEHYPSPTAMASRVPFRIYALDKPPAGHSLEEAYVLGHISGAITSASVYYTRARQANGRSIKEATVDVSATLDFPHPYPLRENRLGKPQPVTFLPQPGYRVPSARGSLFFWKEEEILYCLRAEAGNTRAQGDEIARTLTRI